MLATKLLEAAGNSTQPSYIEDVFSTYLYTGTVPTAQTITNGIDLAGKGGMTWIKSRSIAASPSIYDTARGVRNRLTPAYPNSESLEISGAGVTSFDSTGFTVGGTTYQGDVNNAGVTFASWTFRKQPKFFDVVTYTGTGVNRTIAHSLGSTPGCVIVKRTDVNAMNWQVYHRSLTSAAYSIQLNLTNAQASAPTVWNSTAPTSTVFSVGTDATVNANGGTYVAYIFAHNAGGFGLTGADNVISCGTFTEGSSEVTVNLGYEPQWLLVKPLSGTQNWNIYDNMRGFNADSAVILEANTGNADQPSPPGYYVKVTSTGFIANPNTYGLGTPCIYIAIRRGPMKTPTSGTSVFAPALATGNPRYLTNFVTDLTIQDARDSGSNGTYSRLTGTNALRTTSTDAEFASSWAWDLMNGSGPNFASTNYIGWNFKRAPGFFDEVCYTGTGSAMNVAHNLGVAPELIIWKPRNVAGSGSQWFVFSTPSAGIYGYPYVGTNLTNAAFVGYDVLSSAPTSTQMPLSGGTVTNGYTYVAYLFASCPGVSKVGSYTGTGATQTINCGFTSGARFVLIKRTDSTGDWYVWDTARGIVSGNDPYLLLNSTAAEVTTTDYIDPVSSGFEISSTAPAAINASGGSYIYLAIA